MKIGKLITLALTLLLTLSFIPLSDSLAANAKLYLTLKDSVANEASNFTLEVHVDDVSDLYAVGFDMLYDVKLVKLVSIEKGPFLTSDDTNVSDILLVYRDRKEEGRIVFGLSKSKQSTGVSGSGVIASFTFNALSKGNAEFKFENVYLKSPDTTDIKADTQPFTVEIKEKDTTPPILEVEPVEPTYAKIAIIKGKTEAGAKVAINGKEVSIKEDGTFTLEVELKDGENKFEIIATDPNGNESKVTLTITKKKPTVIILVVGNKTVFVNGTPKEIEASPFIDKASGRTLIPIRIVVESIEGKIDWNATERKVTITKDNIIIELWIDNPVAKINGIPTPIDIQAPKLAPKIVAGRTFLPLRFVAENLGCEVGWDGKTQTITITYPKPS
jgi:hypothetical protein